MAERLEAVLRYADKPLTRQLLEAVFVHDLGLEPTRLTNALRKLVSQRRIVEFPFHVANRARPSLAYGLRDATQAEVVALNELLTLHFETFDRQSPVIGRIGEHYVYACLAATRRFRMPPRAKLGYIYDASGKYKLDLQLNVGLGREVGVSIRNQREVLYPTHKHFQEMARLQRAFGMPCVLVAAHISQSAKDRLTSAGIRWYELQRQLLPSELPTGLHVRTVLSQLRPVIGPQPYELVPTPGRLPRRSDRSARITRDIELIARVVEEASAA